VNGIRPAFWSVCLLAVAWPASAERLSADVTPLHYQLTVTPDFGTGTFDGNLTIDLQVQKATNRVTLHAVDLEIYRSEITLPDGRSLFPTVTTDGAAQTATFTVTTRLLPGTLKLRVEYGGRLRSDGRGFYLVRANGRKYVLSQMEATDARRAFPCFDEPAFKASFAVSAVVDERLTAISNGKLVSDTPGPKFGKHTLRFGTTPKMSSYLVALAIGDFGCIEGAAEGIPVRVCAVSEKKDLGRFVLDVAERVLRFDTQYFTFRYPFRKLDLLAVPGNFPGAMENAGAIFFDEGLLVDPGDAPEEALARTAEVVSHEIAHQWLGDIVTLKWWDDLWLNEGLATWMAPKALQAWKPQWRLDLSDVAKAGNAMRSDSLRSTRAVRTVVATEAEIEESFDQMAYDKAAALLRMVEAWVGPEAFRSGLNAFVRARAYDSATGEELWSQLATASGDPVDRVMLTAATRPGVPVVGIDASCDGSETVLTVTQQRFTFDAPGQATNAAAWQIPLAIRGVNERSPTSTSTPKLLTEPRQTFRIGGCFPAVLADAGAAGYFYTSYRPEALAFLASVARERLTPAERIRSLNDAWTLAGAGVQDIGGYLALVNALAADSTPEVIEEIAGGLTFIRDYVVSDQGRAPFEAWVRKMFGPVAADLGWRVAPGESADRKRLRAAVLGILGGAGRDPDVLATARTLAAAHLAGAQTLDPSLGSLVTRLAARDADTGLLGRLQSLDAQEAIAGASDPSFVTRALGDALKGRDGETRIAGSLAAALQNPAVNAQAWQFLKSRWSEVQPNLTAAFALPSVITAAGTFCDGEARDDVARFFADKATATPRTLQLTLDRIDACRDARLRLESPLVEWLKTPGRVP